jgi:ADP-heptose:LPS heptosyltransferase
VTAPADFERILVIKLGALGDFVLALRAMAQIRRAHAKARITLLTTAPYADLARASGYFDDIDIGGRPKGLLAQLALIRRLRRLKPQRVYDLQTSSRTRNYLYAFLPRPPQWCGISPGASHRHRNPRRDHMQSLDRLWDQIAVTGIVDPLPEGQAPGPDLGWAIAAGQVFDIPRPYALLAPGASPGRPLKRWPADRFAALAVALETLGLTPVVIGGLAESEAGAAIARAAPSTRMLAGKTRLIDLAGLGARAALLVGNDTGPTHLAALAGAPSLVLFSRDSDPALNAPRAGQVVVLQRDDLADLSVDEVTNAARLLLGRA